MERASAWIARALAERRPLRRPTSFAPLLGGMGARKYWRVSCDDGSTAVLMHALPEDPAVLPPALRNPGAAIPFVEVGALLARHQVPVPEILAVEPDERWVLLEDVGDTHILDLPPAERAARLSEALALLARVHAIPREDALPFRRRFDFEWVRFELGTFLAHGGLPEAERPALEREVDSLAHAIAALPAVLCLRDYQSQNLMIDSRGRLRVLDFQDALLAPAELDLASLVCDSYVALAPEEQDRLVARFAELRGRPVEPSAFALLVVQRKCKDYGRYRYASTVRGDTRYAKYMEPARAAVLRALPALPAAQKRLAEQLRRVFAATNP